MRVQQVHRSGRRTWQAAGCVEMQHHKESPKACGAYFIRVQRCCEVLSFVSF